MAPFAQLPAEKTRGDTERKASILHDCRGRTHSTVLRVDPWVCVQGAVLAMLFGPYRMPGIKPKAKPVLSPL